ncbi:P-loop containing nucleoside triphosphate hydrolase protein [Metschnikowia bicuspidata var. bicuspidata NRRL YB-4993]|uniref:p-loop containing nucleoside triphosphate hydrolase protein n=1 Tax=Metschnikowia bicuspidata var. bicuspidata NRRL YB-4993 TaxID=869754 RepID=A0A1A0GYW0_9ASCO|nr:P-loop containing nucleoside triphosphate hydrolase protein [Metschnikowia bicuspidata var. bicuspidata NRRL YB-4993]OBA16941.1 P-loop containing nucleoside triphosphate hydrolase protein [Metschnikowia bicuspidata var. bicuspidata NRRL YB-4993]
MTLELAAAFLDRHLATWTQPKPLVVGISGPQGLGKSHLADGLLAHCQQHHPRLNCVGVLIDDFYLTHAQQERVSACARRSGNSILEGRGLPGTHDLPLATSTMAALVAGDVPVRVPRYDKGAFGGAGDRVPQLQWHVVDRPADVIVLEGWFNGYRRMAPGVFGAAYLACGRSGAVLRSAMHHLADINARLGEYEELWDLFDCSIVLCTQDLGLVYRWRRQQEAALVARTGRGMTDGAVDAFVRRYMPMYELYYWRTCAAGLLRPGTTLCLQIDLARRVTGQAVK